MRKLLILLWLMRSREADIPHIGSLDDRVRICSTAGFSNTGWVQEIKLLNALL